jgi:hypothetical protein
MTCEAPHSLPVRCIIWLSLFYGGGQAELELHRTLDRPYIRSRQTADTINQTLFADRAQLVGHGLVLPAPQSDERLTRIRAIQVAGQRNRLHPIQILIGCVVAGDNGWSPLANLVANSRLKVHPPHLPAGHHRHL